MNYEIVFGDGALDDVERLRSDLVLRCIEFAFIRLAADPVGLSQRSLLYPFGQHFDFECATEAGVRYDMRAHFYYLLNERDLKVYAVTAYAI